MKEKIEALRKELHKHNHSYYVLNTPLISDKEFDMKMKELQVLEANHPEFDDLNSPTCRVGSDLKNDFAKIKHKYPMLSLGNTYSTEELIDFDNRVRKLTKEAFEYVCELKFDGTSVSLTYIDGLLHHAVTRGNSEEGDDITENVKTIKSIPLQLTGDYPHEFEVRGEVIMPHKEFSRLNKERVELGEDPFSNPRNASSGSLKQKKPSEVSKRNLDTYFYFMLGDNLPSFHSERIQLLQKMGFKTYPNKISKFDTIDQITEFIEEWREKRKELPFDIDGLVIKIDDIGLWEELGFTSKTPRWAISYKYDSEQAVTKLNNVIFSVGKTGTVTPVAELEPVELSGSVIRRASLYNEEQMNDLEIKIYDDVIIEKGGEIIPQVVGVNQTFEDSIKIVFATHCPDCGTELVKNQDEAAHYCPNEYGCFSQISGKIKSFVSRKAMNIDSVGEKLVELLLTEGLIKNVADLYDLEWEQLAILERLGEKSAKKAIESIKNSVNMPAQKVLYAIGIRYVGEGSSKRLMKHFGSIYNIQQASKEELMAVEDIGEVIADSIENFFMIESNSNILTRLDLAGLQFEAEPTPEPSSNKLEGMTITLSGIFSRSRGDLKTLIFENGGKNGSGISSRTTFFLQGEKCGPSKMNKVIALNIPIITEEQLMDMISD